MHALIIEDHDAMADVISAILTAADHTVVRASDGRAGVAMFDQADFDLVITDIIMPNQEGLETIRQLVKRKPDVRIIAVSGSGNGGGMDYLRIAREFGAAATLQKPFRPEDLLRLVQGQTAAAAPAA